ncbi:MULTISPECIES: arsenate reductase ArsC [Pseudomonadaceae]|jgi:arsenate reductase (thioredoxin)|uniref:arsenate reductase ArsC n=1 Tax=Pseudomonadaceae TaxID=135621 RepID=UPI0011C92131|nr:MULTISPECIES: arsenate reductase ArsC [Pseudomonadaceae]MCL8045251.1 arsenate reductase ArsC [Pseudomonas aeruginosa]MCU9020097.1 arsenate reductase ArsC [Pseudomonas aeruginosa]MDI9736150.1 arsenate reductase ArsC [Stutzerimonas stutzeri]TXR38358.1 arsenate reductase ArsC [Pseudomonas mendocina]
MNILFLCTANSCRSILAEAVFNHLAPVSMRAVSAGSKPCGWVHPQSLKALARAGIEQTGLYSKSQEVHAQLQPDVVITLCDNAANEPCPAYFDQAFKAHWGLADPAAQQGSEEEINAVFDQTVQIIRARVERFLQLPFNKLDTSHCVNELKLIGEITLAM